jgi:hypothetical protein
MTNINPEFVVESLWQAFGWEPIKAVELFDRIANRLHRNPRLRGMTISEIDLLLADARREFELDVDEFECRLVQAFKDALEFNETEGADA